MGPVAFAAGYAASALLPVPEAALSVAGGSVFGVGLGAVVVLTGALTGALIAFALARRLGRSWVQRRLGDRAPVLQRSTRDHGLAAVTGLRLVPLVPFTAPDLACGVSPVCAWPYTVGSAIGMVPGTPVAVTLGARGDEPSSAAFLTAAAAALLLGVGGLVVGRRWRARDGRTAPGS